MEPARRIPLSVDLDEHTRETVEQRIHPHDRGEQLFRLAIELRLEDTLLAPSSALSESRHRKPDLMCRVTASAFPIAPVAQPILL